MSYEVGVRFFFFPCGYLGDAAPFVKEAVVFYSAVPIWMFYVQIF